MDELSREKYLKERLSALLTRRSAPVSIKSNTLAQIEEVSGLLRTIIRLAPSRDFSRWWGLFEDELLRQAKTRAWPTQNELEVAATSVRNFSRGDLITNKEQIEAASVDRLIKWFKVHKNQMPSHGSPSRTADLIRRGILANEREAKYHGFDLGFDQDQRALEQMPSEAEQRNHKRVMAKLNRIQETNMAHYQEVSRLKHNLPPGCTT